MSEGRSHAGSRRCLVLCSPTTPLRLQTPRLLRPVAFRSARCSRCWTRCARNRGSWSNRYAAIRGLLSSTSCSAAFGSAPASSLLRGPALPADSDDWAPFELFLPRRCCEAGSLCGFSFSAPRLRPRRAPPRAQNPPPPPPQAIGRFRERVRPPSGCSPRCARLPKHPRRAFSGLLERDPLPHFGCRRCSLDNLLCWPLLWERHSPSKCQPAWPAGEDSFWMSAASLACAASSSLPESIGRHREQPGRRC